MRYDPNCRFCQINDCPWHPPRRHHQLGAIMGRDFSRHFGGSPKAPPPPPPPPQKTDAEIQAEKAKAAKLARNRKGRGASILTESDSTQFLQPEDRGGRATLG